MELQTAGTIRSTQKKIYEKPRIEIVNLVADEMVLGTFCQTLNGTADLTVYPCSTTPDVCRNS